MELTVAFITGRQEPRLDWFMDSLARQRRPGDVINVIVVDALRGDRPIEWVDWPDSAYATKPKPTIWQGKHRVTREDWWAMSNARNTAFAYCKTEWIAFCDDRCLLESGWLDAVRRAQHGEYVVCGTYEKRHWIETPAPGKYFAGDQTRREFEALQIRARGIGGHVWNRVYRAGDEMSVGNGGTLVAIDNRWESAPERKYNCGGQWLYGCTFALPLEWALDVNGFEEGCDGQSAEDYIFGMNLWNAGRPIVFDPDMKVVQDRSPGNENRFRREDKGVSPNDKSHAALARFGVRKRTEFTPDLRQIRADLDSGKGFPIPDPNGDYRDWFDNQPIREM